MVALHAIATFEPDLFPQSFSRAVDPSIEGGAANAVSAAMLAALAALSALHAARALPEPKLAPKVGWATLTVTAAFLSFDELTDFHINYVSRGYLENVGPSLGFLGGFYVWVGLALPVIILFLVIFVWFARSVFGQSRGLLTSVISCGVLWVGVLIHEALAESLFLTRAPALENLLEEGAELLGAAGLASVAALLLARRAEAAKSNGPRFGLDRLLLRAGLTALAIVAGGLIWALFRAEVPLTNWGNTDVWMGPFPAESGAVQTLVFPDTEVSRLDIKASYSSIGSIPGQLDLRLHDGAGTPIRESKLAVPPNKPLAEVTARFSPFFPGGDKRGEIQIAVPAGTPGEFVLSVIQGDPVPEGSLFPNDEPAPPDQDLDFKFYGPRPPSFEKVAGLGALVIRDPSYAAMLVDIWALLALGLAPGFVVLTLRPMPPE